MNKLPTCLMLLAPWVVLGGCASVDVNGGSRDARLPTGVTLLGSDRDECGGIIQVREERSTGQSRGAELVLRQGQNATFEIDEDANSNDDEIEWTCIGESSSSTDSVDCPDDTSHVRITRSAQGEDFLLECFGSVERDR
jgi:hypothetical protein